MVQDQRDRVVSSRKTSKRTRIETCHRHGNRRHRSLREKHPREQGLKLLRHDLAGHCLFFEKNIQENKDWNSLEGSRKGRWIDFEKNIQENKDWNSAARGRSNLAVRFEKNIQENKDWNYLIHQPFFAIPTSSRKTSKRTRIETRDGWDTRSEFPNLREKHPREQGLKLMSFSRSVRNCEASRKTSKRTRIETRGQAKWHSGNKDFEKNIQENKDWNFNWIRGQNRGTILREKHPREQGLKH